jgi:Na+/H+ antiporter NhaC
MVISIGAVLEGAIFGDHCSPISDTTVMSSIASASDHIDHVRTQTPYALVTMAVAMACGYLPATIFGLSPWLSLILGFAVLTGILFLRGRKAELAT